MAERQRPQRRAQDRRPAGLLRRKPRHSGRVVDARPRRAGRRRPQRHGQEHAVQHHRRPESARAPAASAFTAAKQRGSSRTSFTGSASAMCRRGGAFGRASRSTSICGSSPPAAPERSGRSSASTRPFRGFTSGAPAAARSFPAASSRCSRSRARCSAIRSC